MRIIWLCLWLVVMALPLQAQNSLEQAIAAYREPSGGRVCDPGLDRNNTWADIAELENSLYVPYGDIGADRVMYVLSAPWCPFCRRAIAAPPSFLRGIELRLVIGELANGADIPRYYRMLTQGPDAVRQMFSGSPQPLSDVTAQQVKLRVDALLLNAFILQMRYQAMHRYFQSIGEARPGPFGFPANIILAKGKSDPIAVIVLGQPDLNILRADPAVRLKGTPAHRHPFIQNPPKPASVAREVRRWPGGVRIHAYPDERAPAFCRDGSTDLFVVGVIKDANGTWAQIEALTINRVSGQGGPYVAYGYARLE